MNRFSLAISLFLFFFSPIKALCNFEGIPSGDSLTPVITIPVDSSSGSRLFLKDAFATKFPDTYLFIGNDHLPSYSSMSKGNKSFLGIACFDDYKTLNPGKQEFKQSVSRLAFRTGSKKNLLLSLNHEQRLSNLLLLNLTYVTTRSEGFYSRQKSNFNKLNVGLSAHNKANTYRIAARYFNFKFRNEESGGLKNIEIFKNQSEISTQLYESNLKGASSIYVDKNFELTNELTVYSLKEKDTVNDSTSIAKKRGAFYVGSVLMFNRQTSTFASEQKESDYFLNTYFDTTATKDTLWFKNWWHELSVGIKELNFEKQNVLLNVSGYFRNSDIRFNQNGIDSTFVATVAGVRGNLGLLDKKGSLYFDFYRSAIANVSDYGGPGFKIGAHYSFSEWVAAYAELSWEELAPTLSENFFYSNHFIWSHHFDEKKSNKITGGLSSLKLKTRLDMSLEKINGLVYYDEMALPQQLNENVAITYLSLVNQLRLTRVFNWENQVVYRHSSREDVLRYPDVSLVTNFYASMWLFKSNLKFEPGIDCRYFTAFYGDSYQPATRKFYLQNESKIGNYPYVDVYVKFGIKSASLFFMLEHANAGLNGKDYFMAYSYPMPGRAFKLMIKWDFVN